MKRAGWRGESYRHYLAAKHVKTGRNMRRKYFAEQESVFQEGAFQYPQPPQKPFESEAQIKERVAEEQSQGPMGTQSRGVTGTTRIQRLQEERLGKSAVEREAKASRADVKEFEDIARTKSIPLLKEWADRQTSPQQKAAAQAKIDEIASEKVRLGARLSREEFNAVSSQYQGVLANEERLLGRSQSAFGQFRDRAEAQLRAAALQTKSESESEFVSRLKSGDAREKYMEERLLGEEGARDFGTAGYFPNPVMNDTRKEPFYGAFNPFEIGEAGYPLNSNPKGGEMEALGLTAEASASVKKPSRMMVSKEVENLYKAKADLAKADTKAYTKGLQAFEKGDREKLVESIVELEGQANVLSNRRNMVNQTKSYVLDEDHRMRLLRGEKSSDMMNFDWLNGSGVTQLAKETERVEAVLSGIRKSQNEVLGRAADLKGKLQRMDATLPPQTSLPKGVVKVFSEEAASTIKNPVPNPVSFAEQFVTR